MYYSPIDGICSIMLFRSSLASDLGSVSFLSLDYLHYGNNKYSSRPYFEISTPTFLFDEAYPFNLFKSD